MRISDEIREQIKKDYATKKYSYATLAQKYGIAPISVGRIVNPDFQERERARNRIRQRGYEQPKAAYTLNLRFSDKDQALIDKLKSAPNKQQYIRDLIAADLKKENT